ncbi:MAG: hypothetical protein MSQ05_07150 [Akkermansia sp.]|nr:hypothetical protein [Akkermansia sp.]
MNTSFFLRAAVLLPIACSLSSCEDPDALQRVLQKNAELRDEIRTQQDKINEYNAVIRDAEQEAADLDERRRILEQEIDAAEKQLTALYAEDNKLLDEVKDTHVRVLELESRSEALQDHFKALQEAVQPSQAQ